MQVKTVLKGTFRKGLPSTLTWEIIIFTSFSFFLLFLVRRESVCIMYNFTSFSSHTAQALLSQHWITQCQFRHCPHPHPPATKDSIMWLSYSLVNQSLMGMKFAPNILLSMPTRHCCQCPPNILLSMTFSG